MEILKTMALCLAAFFVFGFGIMLLAGVWLAILSGKEEKERLTKYFYEERGRLPRDNAELYRFMDEEYKEPELLPEKQNPLKADK